MRENSNKTKRGRRKKSYVTKAISARPPERKFVSKEEFGEMLKLLLTLEKLSKNLVSELSVEDILTGIMKTLGEALGAVWVNIWELTPDKKGTFIRQGYGRKGTEVYIKHSREHPLKIGTAFIGRALKTKKTWSSSDMWTDPHLPRTWIARVKEQGFRGIICTPQIVESAKVVGGMCVYFDHVRQLSDFEMRLITIAANQAAVSVVNANIYNELLGERDKTLATINSLNEGVILYDNDGRIILTNPRAQEILMINSNEAVGKIPAREPAKKDYSMKNLYEISNIMLADYETKQYIIETPGKIILEVAAAPVHGINRKKIGYIRTLRDVTREKEADMLKSRFITTASHQLRTPAAGLRWSLDALRNGSEGKLTESQQNLADKAYKTMENLGALIDNLLNISMATEEEHGFKYSFKEENLLNIVNGVIDELSTENKERGVGVVLNKPEHAIPPVALDKKIFSMAIYNLIDNAVRYSSPGKTVYVSITPTERQIAISIKDSGIGIPKEEQRHIFSKFFRAPNAQLFQTEGSGLGLYLTKSIVDRHNGEIKFESRENEGTEFSIYLPTEKSKKPL
ncbi:MAG: ATP-binding protein [Patescibacteria group bacterium]